MSANRSIDQSREQRTNRLLALLLIAIGAGQLSMLIFERPTEESVWVAAASVTLFAICAFGLLRGWRWAKSLALVLLWLCAAAAIIQAAIAGIALSVPPVSSSAAWLLAWHTAVACGIVAATVWLWRAPRNGV